MEDITLAFRCPAKLIEKIDAQIAKGEYMNRGDAGRDLVRHGLQIKEESERNEKKQTTCECVGVPASISSSASSMSSAGVILVYSV
jgi:Arc/MetJ-type ribon-helix-helix transcriptional regulator